MLSMWETDTFTLFTTFTVFLLAIFLTMWVMSVNFTAADSHFFFFCRMYQQVHISKLSLLLNASRELLPVCHRFSLSSRLTSSSPATLCNWKMLSHLKSYASMAPWATPPETPTHTEWKLTTAVETAMKFSLDTSLLNIYSLTVLLTWLMQSW